MTTLTSKYKTIATVGYTGSVSRDGGNNER